MGKFDDRESAAERASARRSAATATAAATVEKKMATFMTPVEMYSRFTYVNKNRGRTNTAILNELIEEYLEKYESKLN